MDSVLWQTCVELKWLTHKQLCSTPNARLFYYGQVTTLFPSSIKRVPYKVDQEIITAVRVDQLDERLFCGILQLNCTRYCVDSFSSILHRHFSFALASGTERLLVQEAFLTQNSISAFLYVKRLATSKIALVQAFWLFRFRYCINLQSSALHYLKTHVFNAPKFVYHHYSGHATFEL